MSFDLLKVAGGLLFFVGSWMMIGSYEEHKEGHKKISTTLMWGSCVVYIIGSILISSGSIN
jgi:hypothetical protein